MLRSVHGRFDESFATGYQLDTKPKFSCPNSRSRKLWTRDIINSHPHEVGSWPYSIEYAILSLMNFHMEWVSCLIHIKAQG